MKEDIDSALLVIEEDYKVCFKLIRRMYDYLVTFGVKEFHQYSKYKWSYDRDKSKNYSYLCIRFGNSLKRKCMVKRRPYMEDADLYKWVEYNDFIKDALDEAYQYIHKKVNNVKEKIEEMKETAEEYEGKLEDLTKDFDEIKPADKNGEAVPGFTKTSLEAKD